MQSQGSGLGTLEKLVGEIMTDSKWRECLGLCISQSEPHCCLAKEG